MPDRDPLVQRFVDEAQIRQLTVEYGLGTDAIGRNDRPAGIAHYRKAFTDDAEIQVGGAPDTRRNGCEAWADYVDGHFRERNYRATQHLLGTVDVQIDGTGDGAHMSSYLHATHVVEDGSKVFIVVGTYVDQAIRQGDGWLIAKRTLYPTSSWWRPTG